ncbi:MAG: hypothetical protein WCL44_05315 [bacterium]
MVLALSIVFSFLLACGAGKLPVKKKASLDATVGKAWPDSEATLKSLSSVDWSLFRNMRGGPASAAGAIAERFRLAGIFCWSPGDSNGNETVRKAIIDNVQLKPVKETVAVEGDTLDGVVVARILDKSVILRDGAIEHEIFLAYSGSATGTVESAAAAAGIVAAAGQQILSTNRFGAYVGENRWIMSRDGLLGYVEELLQSPARVDKLFDSMVAVYETNDRGRRIITAHQLKTVGEKDFYEAVGLKEGDIVLKVNTEPVTSKRRAVKWIEDFRTGKESAFVLDIERNGNPMRLEYMIR